MKWTHHSVEILRGHTSQETAYVVDDYPYGFRLRCKIRYWLEQKVGHGTRLVSQTTNPKRGDAWNKPKPGVYLDGFVVMFLDEKGHVNWAGISAGRCSPKGLAEFRRSLQGALNPEEIERLAALEREGRVINQTSWAEFDGGEAAKSGQPAVSNPFKPEDKSFFGDSLLDFWNLGFMSAVNPPKTP